jgi:hypothetical protein
MMPLLQPLSRGTLAFLLCLHVGPPQAKPRMFTVDDFPVTERMIGPYTGRDHKSGGLLSSDKVWFGNKELNQTLVFELYTDNFRNEIFLFRNDDIPAALIDSMELLTPDSELAPNKQKEKYFHGFLRWTKPIRPQNFISDKGFALGDPKDKALQTYGKPDTRSIARGVETLGWTFVGENEYDGKTNLKGKSLARDSFGHTVTMCFRNDRLIALILQNDIP